MEVTAEKLTELSLIHEVLRDAYGLKDPKMSLAMAYIREHTLVRLQLFKITMKDIPSKVSVHLVRHSSTGQFHLVKSHRGDWNHVKNTEEWDSKITRATPVNHIMVVNAGHLLDMAKKRLCYQAEKDTRVIMNRIRNAVSEVDPDLAAVMVPQCVYRNGLCPEKKTPCQSMTTALRDYRLTFKRFGGII